MTNENPKPSARVWKIWCTDIRKQAVAGVDTGPDGCEVIEHSHYLSEVARLERDIQDRVDHHKQTVEFYENALNKRDVEIARLHEKYDLQLLVKRDVEQRDEIERLKSIIAKGMSENDEFGAEYVHVSILKRELSDSKYLVLQTETSRDRWKACAVKLAEGLRFYAALKEIKEEYGYTASEALKHFESMEGK